MNFFENKTIVVPFDFSQPSMAALQRAVESVADTSRIHVIHVVVPTPPFVMIDQAVPVPPSYDQQRRDEAIERMQAYFEESGYRGLNLECRIGDPGFEITDWARHCHADLIMMPTHGRSGFKRLMLGSVAERVLRSAPCAVLILRGPE